MADATPTPGILPLGKVNTGAELGSTIVKAGGVIMELMLTIGFILAIVYLIWSGIQYISSAGNPEKTKTARQGIIYAVTGIIIITCTYGIVYFAIKLGSNINTTLGAQTP